MSTGLHSSTCCESSFYCFNMFEEHTLQQRLSWVKLREGPRGEHSYTFLTDFPTWHSDRHGLDFTLVQKEKGGVEKPGSGLIQKENEYIFF